MADEQHMVDRKQMLLFFIQVIVHALNNTTMPEKSACITHHNIGLSENLEHVLS